jgi:ABC-type cobalamin/Fe3+-siderophores transport system ATPase subunit
MVLHDVNLAVRLCSHLILLDGKTAVAGTIDETATAERLSALYGCSVREIVDTGRRLFVTD